VTQASFDFDDGAARKANGTALVADHNSDWMAQALGGLQVFACDHREFTAEQFRAWWLQRAGDTPQHHNAWGALFLSAARLGFIEKTGRYVSALSPRTHAHPVSVWKSGVTQSAPSSNHNTRDPA
jgi:hypothetical protein